MHLLAERAGKNFKLLLPKLKAAKAILPKLVSLKKKTPHILGAIAGLTLAYGVYIYLSAPAPTISITTPADGQAVTGETLFISGKVLPVGSRVSVNGMGVSENGDGTFTAVVTIPEGKSTITVLADYRGKKAEAVQLVTRELTDEEKKSREDERKKAQRKDREEILGVDQKIEELLVAYNNKTGPYIVRILDHKLKEKAGYKTVMGSVLNGTKEDVYWVKITATFYDDADNPVDTKFGFAVSLDEFLRSGETASFETQFTSKEFTYYKLAVDWKKNSDLGAVDSSELEEATKSGKQSRKVRN